ncbi:hypothetical protein OAO18_01365 [Francisellaceae bacterium]|nr:hypothetical protein [Francisellaceae bacterium]
MFISKLNAYLEKVDPYYTQRLIARKGAYIAILILLAYILFQPKQGFAYIIAPFLGYFIFELPIYNTYKKKYSAIIYGYGSAIFFSSLFILLSPNKIVLYTAGVICFFSFCYLTIKYLPQFKVLVMPFFLVSIAFVATEPAGSLQAMKSIAFAISLALLVIIIGYKTHQNIYLEVWYRALKISIKRMEKNLQYLLNDEHIYYDPTVMVSINTMAEYKRLIPRLNQINTAKIAVHTRSLNMTIIYLRSVEIDKVYWQNLIILLRKIIQCMDQKIKFEQCRELENLLKPESIHQKQGYKHLSIIIKNWNKICTQV